LIEYWWVEISFIHTNIAIKDLKKVKINSQIILSSSMKTFTYQGLPKFRTKILVGKKKKKKPL
jgi:hypothetical protein